MTSDVPPKYAKSVEFLEWWRPGGPWALTAIHPDRKSTTTRTFTAGAEVLTWLEKQGEASNIYFHVNPLLRPMDKKAEKEDVASLDWLHVDVDPRAGEDFVSEQRRILKLLRGSVGDVPQPSCIIFSGGGYQAFWRLTEPVPVQGQEAQWKEAERYNKQLEILFGADPCHNVDRIMRVPGTVNRPNANKRKRGRKPALAKLVDAKDDRVYPIEKFTPAPLAQGPGQGFTGKKVKVSGNVQRLADVDELGDKVSSACKVVIVQGHDPDNPNKWPSRSECLFWVCCEMVRAGVDDDKMYSVLTDPGFAISRSVLDKGSRADQYALRQIERAKEEAVDPWLRQCNERHAVIGSIGGKCRIISEEPDATLHRTKISYQSAADFRLRYANKFVAFTTAQGNTVTAQVGSWWLKHPDRREYDTIVFAPGRDVPGSYNLWTGFAYDAKPGGSCQKYLDHLLQNVCQGHKGHFDYVVGWMATAVQHPDQPGHTAIVLRGHQGTGKSVMAKTFGKLFGRHFLPVSDPKHLVGSFNAHLRDCVILFGDEAFYAGDKKHESILKMLVTEDTITVEAKGVDAESAPNYVHLIMASNDRWVVPAGYHERRFLVLDVGDDVRQDKSYFGAIDKELKAGGYEALLYFLMTYDLEGFEVRTIPKTAALQEQKIMSFKPDEEWWYHKLQSGAVFEDGRWPQFVFATHLAYDFTTYTRLWNMTNRGNSTRLGRFMRSICPKDHDLRKQLSGKHEVVQENGEVKVVERPRVYHLPSLKECRAHWDSDFGGPYDWPEMGVLRSPKEPEEKDVF